VTVTPMGYSNNNEPKETTIDGVAYKAEVADLNNDNWPELLVYVASKDDARRGSVVGYSSNAGRSMSEIEFPGVAKDPRASAGYSGHDDFQVTDGKLVETFPLTENGKATDKTRQVRYKLLVGEEAVFRVDTIIDR